MKWTHNTCTCIYTETGKHNYFYILPASVDRLVTEARSNVITLQGLGSAKELYTIKVEPQSRTLRLRFLGWRKHKLGHCFIWIMQCQSDTEYHCIGRSYVMYHWSDFSTRILSFLNLSQIKPYIYYWTQYYVFKKWPFEWIILNVSCVKRPVRNMKYIIWFW